MLICYVNESGCSGELSSAQSPVQPLLVFAGVAFEAARLPRLTQGLLDWKRRFFPGLHREIAHPLDGILVPVRGTDLRRAVRISKKKGKFALRALSELLALLEAEDARLLGRVWIKGIDEPFNRRAIFASSLQTIFDGLGDLCEKRGDTGWVVADSFHRLRGDILSQQIFSRRFGGGSGGSGSAGLARVLELPTFGHRDNHAGLQIAEILASGLLFPLGAYGFCRGHVKNETHLSERYATLKQSFGARLEKLQHRYQDAAGKWQGGIVVSDLLAGRPGGLLFR